MRERRTRQKERAKGDKHETERRGTSLVCPHPQLLSDVVPVSLPMSLADLLQLLHLLFAPRCLGDGWMQEVLPEQTDVLGVLRPFKLRKRSRPQLCPPQLNNRSIDFLTSILEIFCQSCSSNRSPRSSSSVLFLTNQSAGSDTCNNKHVRIIWFLRRRCGATCGQNTSDFTPRWRVAVGP